jgi:hypothetical protein
MSALPSTATYQAVIPRRLRKVPRATATSRIFPPAQPPDARQAASSLLAP